MQDPKVFVFRCLIPDRPKFAVRELPNGPITEVNEVWLVDATFRVSSSGRLRALRSGRRTVHAGIVGRRVDHPPRNVRCDVAVSYNPHRAEYFVNEDHRPVYHAPLVHLIDGKVYIPREPRWL